ncbi:DUF2934 domain-containing protein [Xanthobacter tagetidis]|uniref:DUF2934 domain-containing protein n=1 Tax=Xanthobacter tagetidis TaxID=60216 RepID=UPI0017B5922F|nr:DUF2934 domain-containing protein [Xanthobacter tagetidis]MBB6307578.1 hypothetical protein [Xanthobacter tagetidis]
MSRNAANSNTPDAASAKPEASIFAGLTEVERDRIKRRAHALWREAGSPQGRDREFWERAELQVLKGQSAAQ